MVGGRLLTDLADVTSDLAALDSAGFWVVVLPFTGLPICARFASVQAMPAVTPGWNSFTWPGTRSADWSTSLDRRAFERAVGSIRGSIAAGDVYQVNLTRRLSAELHREADIMALGSVLSRWNPAPFSAVVQLPDLGVEIASASPERFLTRRGNQVKSSPIKGTADSPGLLTDKDRAENVMIVDLVRNDLGRVCEYGTVCVSGLLRLEHHPGLVHLVSTVSGTLRRDVGWVELLDATFPPGSVTGAPKLAALEAISELEPIERGPYCGAIGWVDADRSEGELNVAIRTFWFEDDRIHFGTGGAVTWDSTPSGEWDETVLKARHLVGLTARRAGPESQGDGMIDP